MLHEAKERQKFVSKVQYLRDMQHKVDSEYQACLRRQEYRKDPNEKKRDQFWGQETNLERSRFLSGSSSKQSSAEEDPLAEPRPSTKSSAVHCDSRLPAIDQTSVKQKHKSTMTPRKLEKAGPSKPSSAAQEPQILSRKRRPKLGTLIVSPETQSLRVLGARSRLKSQLPAKAPALRGPDPIIQQEGPMWASDTKLKRPTRERRNVVSSSQLMTMTENTSERAKKGDSSALSQNEPHPALPQAFQGTNTPQVLSESLRPPLLTTTMGGPRRAPFRFRDEDFYSILSLDPGGESDDTEEETLIAEELLLVGMRPPRSPPNHKRSRFLGTLATQDKNKNFEENPENCRANSVRRNESSHGSLRISNAMELVTEPPPLGPKVFQDPEPPNGGSPRENDNGNGEHKNSTFPSWDTESEASLDGDLNAENVLRDCTSVEDRPGTHDYERDWHAYLNSSSNSLDYFLSGRPTAPRSPVNSSYNIPGSLMHSAMREDIPVDLSMSSTFIHSADLEGNSRFNVRRPLSPIRNRNPFASAENQSYFPVNSVHEFDVRGADVTLTSPSQGAPLYAEDLLLNSQSSLSFVESSSSSPSRMNLQGHLHVPGSLQENIPFTFFAVSDFPNQSDNGNRMAVSAFKDEKEAIKIKADPEKLKKLQESLLQEDSEEEDGDLCRICQIAGGSPTNPLLEPCGCVGSLRFVHQECLKKWLKVKITSGADLGAVKTCEMCKQGLLVDLDDFNVTDFYQKHQQSQAQNELMNSGLYLVLLLHLYEQRFAELMRLNYNRVARERVPRVPPGDSDADPGVGPWRAGRSGSRWGGGEPPAGPPEEKLDPLRAPQGGAQISTLENPIWDSGHAVLRARAARFQRRGEEGTPVSAHKGSPTTVSTHAPRPRQPPGPLGVPPSGRARAPLRRPGRERAGGSRELRRRPLCLGESASAPRSRVPGAACGGSPGSARARPREGRGPAAPRRVSGPPPPRRRQPLFPVPGNLPRASAGPGRPLVPGAGRRRPAGRGTQPFPGGSGASEPPAQGSRPPLEGRRASRGRRLNRVPTEEPGGPSLHAPGAALLPPCVAQRHTVPPTATCRPLQDGD